MSKKILIVEDEHDLIKLIKYNLEKESFRVSYTSDGSLALAEMRRDPPDLVILDLMLPGLDGLEVCRRVKANPATRTTRILVVTAFVEERTAEEARRSGADGFLRKPLRLEDLKAEVERLIRARRARRPRRRSMHR